MSVTSWHWESRIDWIKQESRDLFEGSCRFFTTSPCFKLSFLPYVHRRWKVDVLGGLLQVLCWQKHHCCYMCWLIPNVLRFTCHSMKLKIRNIAVHVAQDVNHLAYFKSGNIEPVIGCKPVFSPHFFLYGSGLVWSLEVPQGNSSALIMHYYGMKNLGCLAITLFFLLLPRIRQMLWRCNAPRSVSIPSFTLLKKVQNQIMLSRHMVEQP